MPDPKTPNGKSPTLDAPGVVSRILRRRKSRPSRVQTAIARYATKAADRIAARDTTLENEWLAALPDGERKAALRMLAASEEDGEEPADFGNSVALDDPSLEPAIPPALLTEPEPVHAVEVDTATGKGRRTALGGGR
jgi:hypothetical protein